jgi:TonB-linked SusC/RagA family outer membrane protein
MKKYLLIGFLTLLTHAVLSQVTITGTVTDANDGTPLPGVNILIQGTTSGAVSDVDGNYSISVEPDATLVFSYIGYISQEIAVGNQTTINVALEPDILALEEVVTIGYGTTRKADATGSVIAINSDDFNTAGATSGHQLISGKIAGVQITQTGGAPGGGATIRIRGGSSLSASNDPLFVVDGVPLDNRSVSGMRNSFNAINPNDIETITVLKDASATAIYGSRASNGVIIITTKKGKMDRPLRVSYDGFVSIGMRTGEIDNLSADEFSDLINERYSDNANATGLLGTANTDWQSEIYQTAIGHDHVLGLSGGLKGLPGGGNMPYRVSIGYHDEDGIIKTSNMKRTTGTVKLNPSFLDDHLKADINLKGSLNNNTFADWGAVGAAVAMDPTQPVKDPNSPYGGYFTWTDDGTSTGTPLQFATSNPLAMLEMRDNTADVTTYGVNAQLDYSFHMLPELTARLNIGSTGTSSEGHNNIPANAAIWRTGGTLAYDASGAVGGERTKYTQKTGNELLDFYFIYKEDLPSANSRLDVTAGYSWQHFSREGTNFSTNAYVNDADADTISDTDYITENYLVSFFGRVNYVFADYLSVTGTLRRDGSSRFAPENRWGLFPSGALALDLADMPIPLPDVINQMKVRFGYGVTGQQDITSNDYPYLPRYTYAEPNAYYQFGNTFVQTLRPEGYDSEIKWEETTTLNLGLDYGFLENRITGQLDLYKRETHDLINFIPVPAGTNLTNQILTNVGDMDIKGIEFNINAKIVSKMDLEWEIGFNETYNVNEIVKLTLSDDPNYKGVFTGGISGGVGNNIQIHSVGYPYASFYVYQQVYDEDGNPLEGLYVDKDGNGSITIDDRYRYKKPAPDHILGFNTYFRWKDLDANLTARANIGNYIYNNQFSSNGTYSGLYNSVGYLSNVTRSATVTEFENPKYFSDYYMENGSFLRIDYLTVGYNLAGLVPLVSNLRVYGAVQNLALITKYQGLDPEVFNGIDNNIYPRPRIFSLGVNVQF